MVIFGEYFEKAQNYRRIFKNDYSNISLIVRMHDDRYCIQGDDILVYLNFYHDYDIVTSSSHLPNSDIELYKTIYMRENEAFIFIDKLILNQIPFIIVDKYENILRIEDIGKRWNEYGYFLTESNSGRLIPHQTAHLNRKINTRYVDEEHFKASRHFNPDSNVTTPRAIRNGRKSKKI